jgi:predicted nucleic acid-binding protein
LICADSSSCIAFFEGESGPDVELLESVISSRILRLPPIVIAELLSNPNLQATHRRLFTAIPQVDLTPGFWERTGLMRADLLRHQFKPKLADTLIAQCCLDGNLPLITRDSDFRCFAKHHALKLLP